MTNRFNFRVWDKENKNFLIKKTVNKAYDINGNPSPITIYSAPDFYSENTLEYCMGCDGFVVMQSTGLTDNNGKEIFEGDVIRYYTPNDKSIIDYIITYEPEEVKYLAISKYYEIICKISEKWLKSKEIIGNIYENPELIKE